MADIANTEETGVREPRGKHQKESELSVANHGNQALPPGIQLTIRVVGIVQLRQRLRTSLSPMKLGNKLRGLTLVREPNQPFLLDISAATVLDRPSSLSPPPTTRVVGFSLVPEWAGNKFIFGPKLPTSLWGRVQLAWSGLTGQSSLLFLSGRVGTISFPHNLRLAL